MSPSRGTSWRIFLPGRRPLVPALSSPIPSSPADLPPRTKKTVLAIIITAAAALLLRRTRANNNQQPFSSSTRKKLLCLLMKRALKSSWGCWLWRWCCCWMVGSSLVADDGMQAQWPPPHPCPNIYTHCLRSGQAPPSAVGPGCWHPLERLQALWILLAILYFDDKKFAPGVAIHWWWPVLVSESMPWKCAFFLAYINLFIK